jgi:hypothetical protein
MKMKKQMMLIAFAILLLPTLAFAQTDLQITQTQAFPTSMTGGNTYSAKYNIKSYSSSPTPVFFTLYVTTTTPIEAFELTLTASINGIPLTCTPASDSYPRNWEFWRCTNNTSYYYFPPTIFWWIIPSSQDLTLNLTLDMAASPQSNIDWKLEVWVEDTLPPEIVLESPPNGSVIKSGTLLNFSIRDNIKLSQAWQGIQLFYDDFDDGDDEGWTQILGTWNVETGEYSQDSGETNTHYFATAGSASWADYLLESRIKVLSKYGSVNAPSILVRFKNLDNFYMCQLRLDQNSLYIVKRFLGGWTLLNSTYFGVNLDEWHTLKCKVEGNKIFAYLHNSTHGINLVATDSDIDKGRIGLNNYNTHSHFDNISVISVTLFSKPYDINTTEWTEGLKIINISAVDIVGNQNHSSFSFLIDNTPPKVENSTVNKTIPQGENATITVDVEDNVMTDTVIVEYNKTTNYTMQLVEGEVGSKYILTIPYPSLGNHSLRYFANDTAGNVNDTVYDWFNVIQVVPPVVASVVISPSRAFDGTTYVKAGNITFNITFDKDMNTSVPLTVTYGTVPPYNNFTVIGNWVGSTKVWSGTSLINPTTPNGNYTLNISGGKDLGGNLMEDNTSTWFVIDTIVPRIVSLALTPSNVVNGTKYVKAGNLNFTITFSQNMNTSINPSVKFGKLSPNIHTVSPIGWINSTTWVGNFTVNSTTGDGLNRISVSGATDLADNVMETNTSSTFFIDTVAPIVRNPQAPDIHISQNQTITVEVLDSTPSSGIANVIAEVNNTNYTMAFAFYVYEGYIPIARYSKYSVTIPNDTLSPGNYTVRFFVDDNAGNTNDTVVRWFYVNGTSVTTGGKIAFLCRDNPVNYSGLMTCDYGIENKTIQWLRDQNWTVMVNKYNVWNDTDLNGTDLIVCSDQQYACNPTPAVNTQHKVYGKPFVEISTSFSARAGYRFGYLTNMYGYINMPNTNIFVTASDTITAGYLGSTRIFNPPKGVTTIPDIRLKSMVVDLADSRQNNYGSTLFKVPENGAQGRYAFVGWFYGISYSFSYPPWFSYYWFYGWTPQDLSTDGNILLKRTLNWAQCNNPIGCV